MAKNILILILALFTLGGIAYAQFPVTDISDETNLTVTDPITLTDDDIGLDEGNISITESQISDLDHWTLSDFASALAGTSTDSLSEGNTNLYDQTVVLNDGTNVSVTGTYPTFTINATDTNTQLTDEQVEDIAGAMVSGNTETLISVTYQDADGTFDFVVDNDLGNYDSSNLSLTESQISDLTHYDSDDFTSDLAATTSIDSITTLSNLNITEAQISDLEHWDINDFVSSLAATTSVDSITTLTNLSITESQISDLDHFTGADITGNETAFDGWDKDASDDYDSGDFDTDFSGKSTTDLSEGTSNLYSQWDDVTGGINSTSNVGINNTSPSDWLTVTGDTDNDAIGPVRLIADGNINDIGTALTLDATAVSGNSYSFISTGSQASGGAGGFAVYDGTNNEYRFRITGSGLVGINTTGPNNTLDVNGGIDGDTLNTGQGDNELYAMDQDVQTGDSPTFSGLTLSSLTNCDTIDTNASGVLSCGTDATGGGGDGGLATTSPFTTGDLVQVSDSGTVNSIATSSLGLLTTNVSEGSNLYFTDERAEDAAGGMFSGNTETLITATYQDGDGTVDLVVDNDLSNYSNATSLFLDGVTATGLEKSGTDVALSTGYNIPLTASTTNWNNFYDTPSNRITAGTGLSWSTNTLNAEVETSDLHDAVTLVGTPDYITLSGQEITRGTIDFGDDTNAVGGDGITITGDSIAADLGTSIDSSEIEDSAIVNADINGSAAIAYSKLNLTDALLEADLKSVNAAADEDILTFESTTGDFEWHTPSELVTAGDALTWDGTTLDFDGGASPGGELGGTWASPTLDNGALDDQYLVNDANDTTTGTLTANSFELGDDDYIGIGSAAERIVFDGTGDDIELLGGNVGIGTSSPAARLDIDTGDFRVFGDIVTDSSSNTNTFVGVSVGGNNTSGIRNTFLGQSAGAANTTGSDNTFFGYSTGLNNTTGSNNTFIGRNSGSDNVSGTNNTFIGRNSGSNTTGSDNTFIGYLTGFVNTSGANNLLLGYRVGDNLTTGSNNILLGYDIDAPNVDDSNTLNIGNLIFGTGLDGTGTTLASGNVGIGDSSPASMLTVGSGDLFQVNSSGAIAAATGLTTSGTVTFSDLANGGFLTTNGSGVLSTSTVGVADLTSEDFGDFTCNGSTCSLDATYVTEQCDMDFVIENPTASEDDYLTYVNQDMTITKVIGSNKGSSDTVTFNIQHGTDRDTASNDVFGSGQTAADTDVDEFTSFNDATVPSGSILEFTTSAASSTQFALTVCYTND